MLHARTTRDRLIWAVIAIVMALAMVLTTPGNFGSLLGIGQAVEGETKVVDPAEPDKDFDNDPHALCSFRLSFTGFTPESTVPWNLTSVAPMTPEGQELASGTETTDVNGDALSDPIDLSSELDDYVANSDQGFHLDLGYSDPEQSKVFFVVCDPTVDPPAECSDGIDNDRDGEIDFPADNECSGPDDDSEAGGGGSNGGGGGDDTDECEDNKDNDGDGLVDWPDDPGCEEDDDDDEFNEPAPTPTPTVTALPAQPLRCAAAAKEFNLPLVVGTKGDDVLNGTDASEVICAKAGDDTVTGTAGNDIIWLGEGNDFAHGGAGNDTIRGQKGNDIILGDDGDDTITGGAGNDAVESGGGNDAVFGQQGGDALDGGPNNDRVYGGPGGDTCGGGGGTDTVGGCEN